MEEDYVIAQIERARLTPQTNEYRQPIYEAQQDLLSKQEEIQVISTKILISLNLTPTFDL